MKQTRLRGFGGTAGAVCLGLFPTDAVAVKSGLGNQRKRVGDKAIMPSSA
jgi:hypothetical protein